MSIVTDTKVLLDHKLSTHTHGWFKSNTIFATLHGSHAYNTNIETSDVDVKGIAIYPSSHYVGLTGFGTFKEEAEFKDPDAVIYELRKFFKLARDCNPNIIEVLNTDESDWITIHPIGRNIIDNRELFMSKKAYYTFFGYARAQLKRINTHYRWLKNPPLVPPTREEMGLPVKPRLDKEQLGIVMAQMSRTIAEWDINWDLLEPSERIMMQERISLMLAEVNLTLETRWVAAAKLYGLDDNLINYINLERSLENKNDDWNHYKEWERSRNPARAALEAKFGYDTKHGMHLVRLIRMCREILITGKVNVKRPDREELLGIRAGSLSYEKLVDWADAQELELADVYKTSTALPKSPDEAKINALCEDSIRSFLWV